MLIHGSLKTGIHVTAVLLASAACLAILSIADVKADAEGFLIPLNKYSKEVRESLIVSSLGQAPGGQIPVAIFKTVGLLREIADVAVDREQERLSGDMVLISAYAAQLKGLHAQGVDTRSDPRARAAIEQLKLLQIDMDSGEHGKYAQPLVYASKNLSYAVTTVTTRKALSWTLGKLFSSLGLDKLFGQGVRNTLANNGPLAPVLRTIGWKKLTARANIIGSATEQLTQQLTSVAAKDISKEFLKKIGDTAFMQMVKKELDEHPSQPIHRTRLLVARESLILAVPVLPTPIAAPAAVIPQAAAIQQDPVQRTISTDDQFIVNNSRETSHSEPDTLPPSAQPTTTREEPPKTARELQREAELRHEWDCAGAGVKAGCDWNPNGNSSWDGEKNKNLHDK